MSKYTLVVTDTGNNIGDLSVESLSLGVLQGSGPKGAGWTGVSYALGTGRFTFTSNDGLGYTSDDIRVNLDADLLDGQHGSYYTSYTDTAIANLLDTAPATLDTLNELAAALGDDPNFATTVTNSIATKVSKSGDTMTGNLTFGDNNKAIFGAGSDLQIYHDGSNSRVHDTGTGGLRLMGSEFVAMQNNDGENMVVATSNGAATLYYDNAAKLATTSTGVNVTGTVTADGLTVGGAASVTGDLAVDTNTLFVDSTNNNVGIGTSSPDRPLEVVATNDAMKISGTGVSSTGLVFETNGVERKKIGIPSGDTALAFYSDAGSSEAMRIDSSGNLLVGTTSAPSNGSGGSAFIGESDNRRTLFMSSGTTASTPLAYFFNPNGLVGYIVTSGAATGYATSSDYRLKEDWQPMVGASDRVLALKPVNFAWKADGTRVDGFLAHEAQEVVPEAVHGTKDAMRTEEYEVTPAVYDDEGNLVSEAVMGTREVPDYQGIDQSKLVPLLTAALQEALTEIAALKDRVAALEA